MAQIFDVAQYIVNKQGEMRAMKLQKLVFYSQAWSLVWDGEELYVGRIEAWANGPVSPDLYNSHRGMYKVNEKTFEKDSDLSRLSPVNKETIDAVIEAYGDKDAYWLSRLTHSERPWIEARIGLEMGERGHHEIDLASMAEYYESL